MARKAARGEADCNKTLRSVRCQCVVGVLPADLACGLITTIAARS